MSYLCTPSHRSYEIIIIGGGVIGLSIAHSLALRGASDVLLIERSQLGNESSFAAGGMLAPQAEADAADDFFRLLCQSRDMYSDFAASLLQETGIDVELDTTGTLYLAFTDHDEQEISRRYEWQKSAKLEVERLAASEVLQLEPSINSSVRSALRFPLDVQVENRRLVSALANSVSKMGVQILLETEVESLLIERQHVTGVKTSRGVVHCSRAIVAAGCWSGNIQIQASAGDHRLRSLPNEPVRGQMICLNAKPQLARHVIYSARGYLVPRHDGRLLAGSTSEHVGYAKQVTAGGVSTILRNAEEISQHVSRLPIIDSWAGLRPRAADGLPVLGPCDEIQGLFYATGHYRNGILLAPVTGELMAEAILTESVSPGLEPFAPGRLSLLTPV